MSLSIGSNANQQLLSLLSQLSATQATPSASAAASTAPPATASTFAPDSCAAQGSGMTGSTTASLSGDVLATLMQLQGAAPSGAQSSDPLQNLFSAMDADGDGTVSQSEMETYLEKDGATQGQADALYTALDQGNASSGLSESQIGSALPTTTAAAQGAGHHHHHHHHQAGGAGSASPVDSLMQALDSDNDGTVSQDELTSFVTANGGTAAQAASEFTALDTSGASALSPTDFATAWQNLQNTQSQNPGGAMMASMLDAFANANSLVAASTASVTA